MAKSPKTQETTADVGTETDDLIPCDVSYANVDKARKHLQGRLRHLVLTNIFATGDPGMIARTVQDLKALDMLKPMLGDLVDAPKPKAMPIEEATAEQAAAQERHKRNEERENAGR